MLFKAGNKILKGGSKLLRITDDFTLEFEVQGTCFPAKMTQGASNQAYFRFDSLNSLSNKIFINYNDGTGEHEYNFKSSGASRQIWFRNLGGATTPETIQGSAWYDETVHFYQDLPEGVKNTVQEEYPQKRIVTIRFENPQNITQIVVSYTLLFGTFPSTVSKYNSLNSLNLTQVRNLENFQQDFYNSSIRNLTFFNIGSVMNNGIPNWVVNSNFLEMINLNQSVNLSSNLATNNLLNIDNLKDKLVSLSLRDTGINYKLPNSFGNLDKLQILDIGANTDVNFRLPDNISDMLALKNLSLRINSLPFSEIERIIEDSPVLEELNLTDGAQNINQDISNDNNSLKVIHIGRQVWNSGAVPSFINKLKSLEILNIQDISLSSAYNNLTSFGDFSGATNIHTIRIGRLPNFTTSIPSWFDVLVNLKNIEAYNTYRTLVRTDEFVDNLYNFVITEASMSVGNTAFRNMNIDIYGSITADRNNSMRPTGTYQQPSGYVQGSDNGTPASQMEKIWVLVNQYGHTWTVKP